MTALYARLHYGVFSPHHQSSSTLVDFTQQADKQKKPPILVFLLKQGVSGRQSLLL
jgi:hypothetical protein